MRRLLAHRQPDGPIRHSNEYHVCRKFQGAHWTMAALAERGHPPGDQSLMPVVGNSRRLPTAVLVENSVAK